MKNNEENPLTGGQVQTFTGPAIESQELHNAMCAGWGAYDPNVYECNGDHIYRKYILTISAPAGWHFSGSPRVNCVRDNQGSFAWNANANNPAFKLIITQSNANFIQAQVSVSSRSIMINLACEATQN